MFSLRPRIIFLLSVSLCFLAGRLPDPAARAADRVELGSFDNQFSSTISDKPPEELGKMIGFAAGIETDSQLSFKQKTGAANIDHYHYQQTFRGVPIWGERVTISRNKANEIVRSSGAILRGLSFDVPDTKAKLSPEAALERAKSQVREGAQIAPGALKTENDNARLVVYVRPSDKKAFLSYEVTFFSGSAGGKPTRPFFLIDANSGDVLYRYEGLANELGFGPGGNQRTGKYYYGKGKLPAFEVQASGGKCKMETADVTTANYNNQISAPDAPFEFKCQENSFKPSNGAFAPMNDAHYFAVIAVNMYRKWYNIDPIKGKVLLRVHYGQDYQNAFWNGTCLTFGDGGDVFYPLVSLDIMTHELSHGFTEQHSGLIYTGESGAINEAFSDMAGEAAKLFASAGRQPEFRIGSTIMKGAEDKPLRYLCEPTRDGRSIDHIKDYKPELDVHLGSGIYNKAFCLLAKSSGWNVRKAFGVFLAANRDYWAPSTTFASGAKDVAHAAQDAGYPVGDVKAAFAAVGIATDAVTAPPAQRPAPPPAPQASAPPLAPIQPAPQASVAPIEPPSAPPPPQPTPAPVIIAGESPPPQAAAKVEQSNSAVILQDPQAKAAAVPQAPEKRGALIGEWSIESSAETITIKDGGRWFHSKHGLAKIREAGDDADLKIFYVNSDVQCSYRIAASDTGKTLILTAVDRTQDPDFCPSGRLRNVDR
jgi:vibriolysin